MVTIQIGPLYFKNGYTFINCRLFSHVDLGQLVRAIENKYGKTYTIGINKYGYFYINTIVAFDELGQLVRSLSNATSNIFLKPLIDDKSVDPCPRNSEIFTIN